MFNPMRHAIGALPYYALNFCDADTGDVTPRRKGLIRPEASETFVLPIRQSFVRDARLMPGTTRMLCLLAGWAGNGHAIETTLGILGRHLSRSERQIQRYLKDAAEEGYLIVTKVANRLGYIIGLRIRINPASIFAPRKSRDTARVQRAAVPGSEPEEGTCAPVSRRNQAPTQESDTNKNNIIFNRDASAFDEKLRAMCERNGIPYHID